MAKNGRKRRPAGEYRLPPKVEQARQAKARAARFRARPRLPQRGVVWAGIGMFTLCVGMTLLFWLPARSMVQHLRSQGVTVAATVISTADKPKYVKVRFLQGPESGTEVKLADFAGMYPDTHTGASMLITYDPQDMSQSLAHDWVEDPPANLPAYGTSVLALVFLALTVAVVSRRRWILRTFGPEAPPQPSSGGKNPGSGGVRLTKSAPPYGQ